MRMNDALADAHARDRNLGSRGLHIKAGGERLLEMVRELELVVDDLDHSPIANGLQAQLEALRSIIRTTHELARKAKGFPLELDPAL